MSDTKVLTLSREFRIYEDDTSLAPLTMTMTYHLQGCTNLTAVTCNTL